MNIKSLLSKTSVEELSEDIIAKREQSIEKFCNGEDILSRATQLVKFIFGLEIDSEFMSNFRAAFKEFDPEFPEKGGAYELKMLGYATLEYLSQKKKDETSFIVQLMLVNTFGFGLRENPRNSSVSIIKSSEEYLKVNINDKRSQTSTSHWNVNAVQSQLINIQDNLNKTETIDEYEELKSDITIALESFSNIFEKIHASIAVNEEELRIISWTSSKTSVEAQKNWAELKNIEACLLIGKELSDLITTERGPAIYQDIISKLLALASSSTNLNSNLSKIVFALSANIRENMIAKFDPLISDLTPLHYAIKISLDVSSKDKFQKILEKRKINSTKSLPLEKFGVQIYRERLFLKTIFLRDTNEF